jgi:hypothetical protein
MGPLTRATLLYDFVEPSFEAHSIDWDEELPHIVNHRLACVAQRMLADLGVRAPARFVDDLKGAIFDWTTTTHLVGRRAVSDLEVLTKYGIDFLVTKGPGIATHTRRLSERPYTDIDIFVSVDDASNVRQLLASEGYGEEPKNIVPWPALGFVCREAVNLRSSDGGSLDVHHRIPPWIWGAHLTFPDVLSRSQPQDFAGGTLICASPEDNLLISALHIVSDKNAPGQTLMAWRDLLVLARIADPATVVEYATVARLCGWLNWVTDALPPGSIPPQLSSALLNQDPWIPDCGRLRLMTSSAVASRSMVFSQVLRLPTPNALRYLSGLVWPSTEFLRLRLSEPPHSRMQWWRTVLRK